MFRFPYYQFKFFVFKGKQKGNENFGHISSIIEILFDAIDGKETLIYDYWIVFFF